METDVQTQNTPPVAQNSTKSRLSKIVDVALTVIIVALVGVLLLRAFVFTRVTVEQQSMMPTLQDGQTVWINKTKTPTRGQIVVFFRDAVDNKVLDGLNPNVQKLIKRVVALEGDCIWLEQRADGKWNVKIRTPDGTVLQEDYYTYNGDALGCDLALDNTPFGLGCLAGTSQNNPYVVPQGCFFAMGDNRPVSADCRSMGAIPLDQLMGVVMER